MSNCSYDYLWPNKLDELKRELADIQENITDQEQHLETQRAIRDEIIAPLETLQASLATHPLLDRARRDHYELSVALSPDTVNDALERIERWLNNHALTIQHFKANATTKKLEIATEEAKDESTKGFNLDDLEKAFEGVAYNFEINREYNELSWTFTEGLQMRVPGQAECAARSTLINNGEEFFMPLPEIHVIFNLKTMKTRITGEETWSFYCGVQTPHPHVLSGDEPCLGDFADPISLAVENKDPFLVVEVIKLFLENCNPADAAGRTFESRVLEEIDAPSYQDDNGTYHFDEDSEDVRNREIIDYLTPYGAARKVTENRITNIHYPSGERDYEADTFIEDGNLMMYEFNNPEIIEDTGYTSIRITHKGYGPIHLIPHNARVSFLAQIEWVDIEIYNDNELIHSIESFPRVKRATVSKNSRNWFAAYGSISPHYMSVDFTKGVNPRLYQELQDDLTNGPQATTTKDTPSYVTLHALSGARHIPYVEHDGFVYSPDYEDHVFHSTEELLIYASEQQEAAA